MHSTCVVDTFPYGLHIDSPVFRFSVVVGCQAVTSLLEGVE